MVPVKMWVAKHCQVPCSSFGVPESSLWSPGLCGVEEASPTVCREGATRAHTGIFLLDASELLGLITATITPLFFY